MIARPAKTSSTLISLAVFAMLFLPACSGMHAQNQAASESANPRVGILDRTQASAIMPATVFFRGQSATIQGRNSAGVRFPGDRLMLAAVVDTGGYATAIAQTYQAYLINEVPLMIGGKALAPGAYGFGFVQGGQMVLMDVGGNELMRISTQADASMKRPTPLQIVAAPAAPGQYRLYLGRSYVTVSAQVR